MSVSEQLKLLGWNVLVLAISAACVACANHIVRFRSGIDNNATLRRLWSKPDAVIFQPIRAPLMLSGLVCLGINFLARSMLAGFLEIIDATRGNGSMAWAGQVAATAAGSAAGALAGRVVYGLNGGVQTTLHLCIQLVLSVAAACSAPLLARVKNNLTDPIPPTLFVAQALVAALVTVLLVFWSGNIVQSRVPNQPVRELHPALGSGGERPKWYAVVCISACIILLDLLRLGDTAFVLMARNKGSYLAIVLRNFSGLTVLVACSLSAIVVTNVNVMNAEFIWQWPSMLLPGLALLPVECVLVFSYGSSLRDGENMAMFVLEKVALIARHVAMYAAGGYLGATFYLGVLARAARIALDPGFDGQSELILDDSDYELDA